jgi:hypothetical protein
VARNEKFSVKVVRLAVEATVVEVEAADEAQAQIASISIVAREKVRWTRVTDDSDYTVHPIAALPVHDDEDDEEPFDLLDYEHHRFALLLANTDSAEGTVLLEPWIADEGDLAIADVAGDWASELEGMRDESGASYFESLVKQFGADTSSTEGSAAASEGSSNVINFAEAAARRRLGLPPRSD